MHRSQNDLLRDAPVATEKIIRFTINRSFEDYVSSAPHVSATERQFEILAEALRVAKQTDPDIRTSIPELGRIVGMRNLIAHEYHLVDDSLIWSVATTLIPPLRDRIRRLID